MDAKKCDRCGKFYERNEFPFKKVMDVNCKNDPVMVGVVLNSDYFDINKTFDLCDECNERLSRFLGGEDYINY